MKLNVENWGSFRIGKLFYKLEAGKANDGMLDNGNERIYLGAKKNDNGVMRHCASNPNLEQDGNCIIFICNGQGSVGYANYMNDTFIGTTDIVAGYCDNLNEYVGLFMATVFCLERPKYSFGRKWKTHLQDTVVKLPMKYNIDGTPFIDKNKTYSDDGYVPDWEFMENYMKSLHYKPLTTRNTVGNGLILKVNEWEEFYISRTPTQSGLFAIENCKCDSVGNLDDGNDINYIGAKKNDNGIIRKVVYKKHLVSKGNGIIFICDGEGSVGYTNYMDEDFIGSTTISIGYNEALKPCVALFLVSILDKEKFKYSYGRKYRTHINDITIKLPIQKNTGGFPIIDNSKKHSEKGYVPDWDFMENYIKSLPYGDRL